MAIIMRYQHTKSDEPRPPTFRSSPSRRISPAVPCGLDGDCAFMPGSPVPPSAACDVPVTFIVSTPGNFLDQERLGLPVPRPRLDQRHGVPRSRSPRRPAALCLSPGPCTRPLRGVRVLGEMSDGEALAGRLEEATGSGVDASHERQRRDQSSLPAVSMSWCERPCLGSAASPGPPGLERPVPLARWPRSQTPGPHQPAALIFPPASTRHIDRGHRRGRQPAIMAIRPPRPSSYLIGGCPVGQGVPGSSAPGPAAALLTVGACLGTRGSITDRPASTRGMSVSLGHAF